MKNRAVEYWLSIVLTLLMAAADVEALEISKTFSVAEVQAEFDELYQRLESAHFNLYARRSKQEYRARFDRMRSQFDRPLTVAEIHSQFQSFVAYGKVAHARIDGLQGAFSHYRQQGGKALPVSVRVVADAMYIQDNYSGLGTLSPGDELLSLNGTPVAALLEKAATQLSADNDYMMQGLVELWFPALMWQQFGAMDRFTLVLRRDGGKPFVLSVPARTRPESMATAATQTSLLELDWDKREARILDPVEAGIGYLRPGPFYNNEPNATDVWDARPFIAFLDRAFNQFQSGGVKTLVIDLRDNPGGDNSFSDVMVSWFASKPYRFCSAFHIKVSDATSESNRKRVATSTDGSGDASRQFAALYQRHKHGDIVDYQFPLVQPRTGSRFAGKVFLLINRRSYSNTVMVAALAQDYGFATIVGEETSDLATTYGAMEQFSLSRTGLTVGYPKAHIIRPNGSTDARGVIPDLSIKTPVLESVDDPVLKETLRLIAGATR